MKNPFPRNKKITSWSDLRDWSMCSPNGMFSSVWMCGKEFSAHGKWGVQGNAAPQASPTLPRSSPSAGFHPEPSLTLAALPGSYFPQDERFLQTVIEIRLSGWFHLDFCPVLTSPLFGAARFKHSFSSGTNEPRASSWWLCCVQCHTCLIHIIIINSYNNLFRERW